MMRETIIILILIGLNSPFSSAQIDFVNRTDALPLEGFYSWMQKSVVDIDNDYLDDIIVCDTDGNMYVFRQLASGHFETISLGEVEPGTPPLSVIVADLDNDDEDKVLTGGRYNQLRITDINSQTNVLPSSDNVYVQASALADINNDGYLDIFTCHDEGTNAIWQNMKDGSFQRSDMGIDLNTSPSSDNSGNYGVVFTDFDVDGDLDFYISKCRAGVNDSSDPRRINQLYVNNGSNNYTESAALYGLDDGAQSWISDFQDIDNDGDFDVLIFNHYVPSRLLENKGNGNYEDISANAGLSNLPEGILQAVMRDFDNDGYIDLIVAGNIESKYYRNTGSKSFTEEPHDFLKQGTLNANSIVVGDLNSDGFYDLYSSYYRGGTDPDQLWINAGNTNNFLPIHLLGYASNRSAIGAKIWVTSGGVTQLKEIRAGESYGLSHTHCHVFGLGLSNSVDEVKIMWPNGQVSIYRNLQANTPLFINQGKL